MHAVDQEVIPFYARYGFRAFPTNQQTLFLPIDEIVSALSAHATMDWGIAGGILATLRHHHGGLRVLNASLPQDYARVPLRQSSEAFIQPET